MRRVFLALLVAALCSAAFGQEALAKSLRTQALEFRKQANAARDEAQRDRDEADILRRRAGALRKDADDAKAKGDPAQADSLNQEAKQAENDANDDQAHAEELEPKAAKLEAEAAEKENQARKFEALSKSAADQVYRKIRETFDKANADVAELKARQSTTRVGRQSMSVRYLFSNIHDEELKPFTQADLNALYQPCETTLAKLTRQVEEDRDSLAAGKVDADAYCSSEYSLFGKLVTTLEDSIFTLVAKGYDTFEADIYKVERKLNQQWQDEKDALAKSEETYDQQQADLAALYQRQSGERKVAFYDVTRRYRSEKNRLGLWRQDWVDRITSWHDLAAKLSKGDDPHRAAATDLDNLIRAYFTSDGVNYPQSIGIFAFSPGSPDRFILPYGDEYPWCKALPFPDVQDPESPGLLRMHGIMDKLPILTRSGKSDGAGRDVTP